MSKQRKNAAMLPPVAVDKMNFKSGDLPTTDFVDTTLSQLTGINTTQSPKNKAKKETTKGTVVFSAMIEKDLMKKVRLQAATTEGSLSDVVNNALKVYFNLILAK